VTRSASDVTCAAFAVAWWILGFRQMLYQFVDWECCVDSISQWESVVSDSITQQGRKKFVLDEKRTKSRNLAFWTKNKIHILDEILRKMANWSAWSPKKMSNSFTFIGITITLLQLGWKNGCLELWGCEWINFLSQNERMHRTAGTTSWRQSFGAYW